MGKSHFLALAANVMRQILVDHHRRGEAAKRGGDWQRVSLSVAAHLAPEEQIDFVALEDALQVLAGLDERQARIVELRFFGGLSTEETARVLGISTATLTRSWKVARLWLARELGPTK
ncbi:MAG: sigma-70 family RNA polymerase sigma factor [Planctomycetaceae bacterium]|nr:sigma-70 family RNA polymerase sigma factor [Planctomycetaceae bacterium]